MAHEKLFFVGVKAVIIQKKKIFLLKDAKKGFWDFPGGRIDGNEDFHDTLRRELSEELPGSTNVEIGSMITAFRVPRDIKGDVSLLLVMFGVKVDLPEPLQLSHEHTEGRWMTFEEAAQFGSDAVIYVANLLNDGGGVR